MIRLYLAPMEEVTGYVFRNVINRHFGHIDRFYTPFISPDNRITKTRSAGELLNANNEGMDVVPQILTNDSEKFNEAAGLIADMGYKEININLGCPSNTVCSKFRGSGILRVPESLDRFLDGVFNGEDSIFRRYPDFRISAKMRVGYRDTDEFSDVASVMNRYPFSEMIVHPRLKSDMYSGKPRMDMFDRACKELTAPISYNGDITGPEGYEAIAGKYESRITGVMIGRGAVADPGIFRQIRTGERMTADELYDFLNDLYESYRQHLSAENAVSKLKEVWSYTVSLIEDEKERARVFKTIIKSRGEAEYKDAMLAAKRKIMQGIRFM
ncbi:MAG: tRNA-dihydrouridine synthase family protein [Lachnospiraceae bacterium]|nr:tRNA-dihydrouridine synthase family protein [Lachnospiraceae bacterium]